MNIPPDIIWEAGLAVIGFIFGVLWGHHGAINKRVTYSECSEKREKCHCFAEICDIKKDITTVKEDMDELHPRTNEKKKEAHR